MYSIDDTVPDLENAARATPILTTFLGYFRHFDSHSHLLFYLQAKCFSASLQLSCYKGHHSNTYKRLL